MCESNDGCCLPTEHVCRAHPFRPYNELVQRHCTHSLPHNVTVTITIIQHHTHKNRLSVLPQNTLDCHTTDTNYSLELSLLNLSMLSRRCCEMAATSVPSVTNVNPFLTMSRANPVSPHQMPATLPLLLHSRPILSMAATTFGWVGAPDGGTPSARLRSLGPFRHTNIAGMHERTGRSGPARLTDEGPIDAFDSQDILEVVETLLGLDHDQLDNELIRHPQVLAAPVDQPRPCGAEGAAAFGGIQARIHERTGLLGGVHQWTNET